MRPCAPGTYQPAKSAVSCEACPEGRYCPEGAAAATPCPENHWCPAGTTYATANPCNSGYSTRGATGAIAESECLPAEHGTWVRLAEGTAAQKGGTVSAGYYYDTSTPARSPIPRGAALCRRGRVCTAGSETSCPVGYFCADEGLDSYTPATSPTVPHSLTNVTLVGRCAPGHYCPLGATSSMPNSLDAYSVANHTQGPGGLCPLGAWCGNTDDTTASPQPCPAGTYGAGLGLADASDCSACPHGRLCPTAGLTVENATQACEAGWYCESGKSDTTGATPCPPGFYCPAGSIEPLPCGPGNFSAAEKQSECSVCSPGNYCPFDGVAGTTRETTCPAGHECNENGMAAPDPCDLGTHQNSTGARTCDACPPGSYCDEVGLVDFK